MSLFNSSLLKWKFQEVMSIQFTKLFTLQCIGCVYYLSIWGQENSGGSRKEEGSTIKSMPYKMHNFHSKKLCEHLTRWAFHQVSTKWTRVWSTTFRYQAWKYTVLEMRVILRFQGAFSLSFSTQMYSLNYWKLKLRFHPHCKINWTPVLNSILWKTANVYLFQQKLCLSRLGLYTVTKVHSHLLCW